MIIEPDLSAIGQIVDSLGDRSSEAWSRYHETGRGALGMARWENHFEWRFLVEHYATCVVLDYGCGTAHSDVYLADAGFAVIGYEPNETNRRVAEYIVSIQERRIRDNITLIKTMPGEDYSKLIELVWINHVLEHVPKEDWQDFFKPIIFNQWKTLISVPLGRAHYVPAHVNIWNNEHELVTDLESAGLAVAWSETDTGNEVIRVEVE